MIPTDKSTISLICVQITDWKINFNRKKQANISPNPKTRKENPNNNNQTDLTEEPTPKFSSASGFLEKCEHFWINVALL